MELVEILLVSIGLAMDAFAVSVCKGLSMKKMDWKKAVITGLWFGVFQTGMPVIGFLLGATFESVITNIDHWIAFVLLVFIGGKMIKEAFSSNSEAVDDDIGFKTMLILSIATSIDALVVGIAYVCAYGNKNAAFAFIVIGVITFIMSSLGVKIGNKFGNKYEKKAEFTGGVILVLLGIKILLEHLGML